jgi:nitrogen fixation protein FixH
MKLVLLLAVATVFALIAATVVVGSKVREETVVEHPYEEGLHHDADRASRAALGLAVAVEDDGPAVGKPPLAFRLTDRQGRVVAGAKVTVEVSRPDTSHGELRADARETAPGRYAADLAFPAAGAWDVRFDVRRGEDRVRLEKRITARGACDLGAGPCAAPLAGGGQVTLELEPRPLRTMKDLAVRARLSSTGAGRSGSASSSLYPAGGEGRGDGADAGAGVKVSVSFTMPGMEMGRNEVALEPGPDGFAGKAVLVRCPSGRKQWAADVAVSRGGAAPEIARFPFTVVE